MGDITGHQSAIRQLFVRQGSGLNLTPLSVTTEPEFSEGTSTSYEVFTTVNGDQWEDFLAAQPNYSETFNSGRVFSSTTPGATYPDSVGAYPLTWYGLSYTIHADLPPIGEAGTCTLTVAVVNDLQEYRRSEVVVYGPPDNPVTRPRTPEDGPGPINSAVYPHGVRFYVSFFVTNEAGERSFGGNQTRTDIIQLPREVDPGVTVPTYPTSFTMDVPENWWGIQYAVNGRDPSTAFARDPINGNPMTASSNGGEVNWYGENTTHFEGVAPKYTITETTPPEYIGDKTVTEKGTYTPFGDTGAITGAQSTYKQQIVRTAANVMTFT